MIYDFENLFNAYKAGIKCKRYRPDVMAYTDKLEENLIELQNEFIWQTYTVGRYNIFYVYEPKKRMIMSLTFKDRVAQHAIYSQLNPYFEKQFISDSYACRVGKGTHKAVNRLHDWLKQTDRKPQRFYYLKLDIAKYFYRIDHEVLMDILRKKIADEEFEKANKAGLKDIINELKSAGKKDAGAAAEEVKMPPKEVVTSQIPGIEVMDLEDAVKALWKAGIYAESGMGCTGPIVLMSDANKDKAHEILKAAGYVS